MIEQVNGFITPMKGWDAVEKNDKKMLKKRIDCIAVKLYYRLRR